MCAIVYAVGPDAAFLATVAEALSGGGRGWRLRLFDKPAQALDAAAKDRPDLVIADETLAGMTGAVFLWHWREVAPSSIRVLAAANPTPRSFACAHQVLPKPLSKAKVAERTRRALEARRHFRNAEARAAVLALKSLPVLPGTYYDLLAALGNEAVPMADIVDLLKQDTAICAGILRMANSPVFAYASDGQGISDLAQCVTLLGAERVKGAVLAHQMLRFEGGIPECFYPARLPQHRWETAELAFAFARKMDLLESAARDAYLAGLLHDLGRLVLLDNFPETYLRVCAEALRDKKPVSNAEIEAFSITQADVIAFLLSLWGMREGIVNALLCHECPWAAPDPDACQCACAVYLAHHQAHKTNPSEAFVQPPLNRDFLKAQNLDKLAAF